MVASISSARLCRQYRTWEAAEGLPGIDQTLTTTTRSPPTSTTYTRDPSRATPAGSRGCGRPATWRRDATRPLPGENPTRFPEFIQIAPLERSTPSTCGAAWTLSGFNVPGGMRVTSPPTSTSHILRGRLKGVSRSIHPETLGRSCAAVTGGTVLHRETLSVEEDEIGAGARAGRTARVDTSLRSPRRSPRSALRGPRPSHPSRHRSAIDRSTRRGRGHGSSRSPDSTPVQHRAQAPGGSHPPVALQPAPPGARAAAGSKEAACNV